MSGNALLLYLFLASFVWNFHCMFYSLNSFIVDAQVHSLQIRQSESSLSHWHTHPKSLFVRLQLQAFLCFVSFLFLSKLWIFHLIYNIPRLISIIQHPLSLITLCFICTTIPSLTTSHSRSRIKQKHILNFELFSLEFENFE